MTEYHIVPHSAVEKLFSELQFVFDIVLKERAY